MSIRDALKVLVVDDMSTSRGIMIQCLENIGIKNIEFADDGKKAMLRARSLLPHVIISDLYMPELNGLQLLQHIRHDPSTKGIGFILVTGRSDGNIISTGKKLGMNNFLEKPFTPDDIKNSLEAVVGRL